METPEMESQVEKHWGSSSKRFMLDRGTALALPKTVSPQGVWGSQRPGCRDPAGDRASWKRERG